MPTSHIEKQQSLNRFPSKQSKLEQGEQELETPKPRWLRRDTVRLKPGRAAKRLVLGQRAGSTHAHGALRQHEARPAQDRCVVLFLPRRRLACLALLVVLLKHVDRGHLLAHYVDHERLPWRFRQQNRNISPSSLIHGRRIRHFQQGHKAVVLLPW